MHKLYHNFILFKFVIIACIASGCNTSNEKIITQETFSFLNDNWDFNQRILNFEKEINTEKPCKIILNLCCTKEFSAEELSITLSLYDSEGSEFSDQKKFNFKTKKNIVEEVDDNLTIYTLTIYPKKYFHIKGMYKFRLLRTYTNYNLLGIKNITVKVVEIKE